MENKPNPYLKLNIHKKYNYTKKSKGQKISECLEKKQRAALEQMNKKLGGVKKINKHHGRKSTSVNSPDLEDE